MSLLMSKNADHYQAKLTQSALSECNPWPESAGNNSDVCINLLLTEEVVDCVACI